MITILLLLATIQMPQRSAEHDAQEQYIYQRLALVHELMPPNARHRLRSDYWKAVGCFVKFQERKVIDCDKQLDRVEHDLQAK